MAASYDLPINFWSSTSAPVADHELTGEAAFARTLASCLILFAFLAYCLLKFLQAPYGRFATNPYAWLFGPGVPGRLAWALQELPSLLMFVQVLFSPELNSRSIQSLPNLILAAAFSAHYFNRAIVYPLRIRSAKPTPFLIFLLAFIFCLVNGYVQSRALLVTYVYPDSYIAHPRFLLGMGMWAAGWLINYHSDHILRNLRKPGETVYRIPRGGAFDLLKVSVANYTGEILEWTGFAVACWNYESSAFLLGTLGNLVPRAVDYHKNYLEKFKGEYPKDRKAVIPFLL